MAGEISTPQPGSDAAAELLQGLGSDLGEGQGGLREVHQHAADALALRRRIEVTPCGVLQLSAQLGHIPAPYPHSVVGNRPTSVDFVTPALGGKVIIITTLRFKTQLPLMWDKGIARYRHLSYFRKQV